MDDSATPTYSISLRLQRTTTEFAFVSVPVTADLMVEHPDGSAGIDVDELMQRAIKIGHGGAVAWQPEGREVHPHPVQTPPPGLADPEPEGASGDSLAPTGN